MPERRAGNLGISSLTKGRSSMNETIGFVGLGDGGGDGRQSAQGRLWTARLQSDAGQSEAFGGAGATQADTPAEAAEPGGIVVTMLTNDAAVEEVTLGENGFAEALGAGGIHLSMSTIAPDTSRRLARPSRGARDAAMSPRPSSASPMPPPRKTLDRHVRHGRSRKPASGPCWMRWARASMTSAKTPARPTSSN